MLLVFHSHILGTNRKFPCSCREVLVLFWLLSVKVQKEKKLKSVSSNIFFRSQMIEERIQQRARKYFGRLWRELRIEVWSIEGISFVKSILSAENQNRNISEFKRKGSTDSSRHISETLETQWILITIDRPLLIFYSSRKHTESNS